MKVVRVLLLFFCILCVCSGCEKKTAEPKEEEIHLVSAEHLFDKQEQALAKKYKNITLSEHISVTVPEAVSVLESRARQDVCTKENFALLCENFFDSYQSEEQMEEISSHNELKSLQYSTDKDATEGNFGQLGRYGAVTLQQKGYSYYEKVLQLFHIDRGEGEDAIYELGGKEISIAEAARFAEEWCEKYWSGIEGHQYQYKVKTAYLCQQESGAYAYSFDICKWYQGIPMNDFAMNGIGTTTQYNVYNVEYLVAHMDNTERLSYFSNQNNGLYYHDLSAFLARDLTPHPYEGECLIDMQQALEIFDQKIAAGQKMKIDEIGLVYLEAEEGGAMTPAWYFAIDEEEYDENGMRTEQNQQESAVWLRREVFMDIRTGGQLVQGSNKSHVMIIE